MPELTQMTWGQLGTLFDGPHATPRRIEEGPYFLNIASLKAGRLDLSESDHVSIEDFAQWTRRVTPQENDLLFSYETRLGEAALMPAGVDACLGRRMALLRPHREVVDPRFLLYYYLSPAFQVTLQERSIHGATVDRIGLATMPSWPVQIPALPTQRTIAAVLGALDDKIAANVVTAEAAQAVMLAVARRATGRTSLASLAVQRTTSLKPTAFDDQVDHYSLPAFDSGALSERAARDSVQSNKFLLRGPSVLIAKLNPRIPRIWNVPALGSYMSVASTEFVVLEPHDCSTSALWAVVSQPEFSTQLQGKVAGTSGSHQRVRPAEMLTVHVLDPRTLSPTDRALLDGLGRFIALARAESARLAATRDELLPLLMSGRIAVRDAAEVDNFVTGVAEGSIAVPHTELERAHA